jgi:hypothetical protein
MHHHTGAIGRSRLDDGCLAVVGIPAAREALGHPLAHERVSERLDDAHRHELAQELVDVPFEEDGAPLTVTTLDLCGVFRVAHLDEHFLDAPEIALASLERVLGREPVDDL